MSLTTGWTFVNGYLGGLLRVLTSQEQSKTEIVQQSQEEGLVGIISYLQCDRKTERFWEWNTTSLLRVEKSHNCTTGSGHWCGLVVKVSALSVEGQSSKVQAKSHGDFKTMTFLCLPCRRPVAMGSMQWLVGPRSACSARGKIVNLICNFYLMVTARKTVKEDPFLRYIVFLAGTLSSKGNNRKPQVYPTASSKPMHSACIK